MSTNRIVRIVVGLALIGYGVYSGNAWFYLGVLPLVTGIINWCPLETKMGTCDPASGCCTTPASAQAANFSFTTKKGKIEILGTGCKKCKDLEMAAKEAVKELNSDYEVIKVEDIQDIAKYGVTSTPALVVDGVVKSTGRVLSVDEIKQLIV